jgi:hypothetical protein
VSGFGTYSWYLINFVFVYKWFNQGVGWFLGTQVGEMPSNVTAHGDPSLLPCRVRSSQLLPRSQRKTR